VISTTLNVVEVEKIVWKPNNAEESSSDENSSDENSGGNNDSGESGDASGDGTSSDGDSGDEPAYVAAGYEEGPGAICFGEDVKLKAIPDPDDKDFPAGHPKWRLTGVPSDSDIDVPRELGGGVTDTITLMDTDYDVPGTYTIEARCGDSTATFELAVVELDVIMQGLDEETESEPNEEAPGGLVLLNVDDDNGNGTPDLLDQPLLDASGDPVDDDDLVAIEITLDPALDTGDVSIAAPAALKLWQDRAKQSAAPSSIPAADLPVTLFVEGRSAGAQFVVEGSYDPADCTDKVLVTVVDGDLTAYRPQSDRRFDLYAPFSRTAVDESDEGSPLLGPGIRVNGDGNEGGAPDDELIETELSVPGLADLPDGIELVLQLDPGKLRLWRNEQPGSQISASGGVVQIDPQLLSILSGGSATIWSEWHAASHGTTTLDLRARIAGAPVSLRLDRLRFHSFQSEIVVFGGLSQFPGGNDPIFNLAVRTLYERGWNVELRPETEDRQAANHIREGVTNRGVTQWGSIGFSVGADSVFDISNRLSDLDADLRYTGYVDAIETVALVFPRARTELPVGTQYHENTYQRRDFAIPGLIPGLRGDATTGPAPLVSNARLGDCHILMVGGNPDDAHIHMDDFAKNDMWPTNGNVLEMLVNPSDPDGTGVCRATRTEVFVGIAGRMER